MIRANVRRGVAGLLISLALAACAPEDARGPNETWVEIRGTRLVVELARTPEEQARGLGGRDSLDWNRGMLFPYAEPAFYGFWMKDMRFDIDIVWIREDRIVDITLQVPHRVSGTLPTYRPRELCDSVLEVPAGAALARGWRPGDRVTLGHAAP